MNYIELEFSFCDELLVILLQNRDVQALLPLTVKQINDALMPGNEKSEFLIDGVDVNNVGIDNLSFSVVVISGFLFFGET